MKTNWNWNWIQIKKGLTPALLKRKILQKSELGHGGGDGERVCREPNEVQGAPSAALRLHWSCS
jgi:hypothetical protein